ncbi:MAG: sodium/proton-translocating pyrophosphatase, partial [Myxococcota bacterium]
MISTPAVRLGSPDLSPSHTASQQEIEMNMQTLLSLIAGALAIGWSLVLYSQVQRSPATNDRANEIAQAIAEGAKAFLSRQYRTVAIVGAPIFILVGFALGWWYAIGFLLGAVASAAAGFIGMTVSVRANVRVS